MVVTGNYLTKVASDPGAGDILMGFLGSVILSFAFSMFKQRKVTPKTTHLFLFFFRKVVTICSGFASACEAACS